MRDRKLLELGAWFTTTSLLFPAPDVDDPEEIAINLDGCLGALYRAARDVSAESGWDQAEAVEFVLSGNTPEFPLPPPKARSQLRRFPALSRVILDASPLLPRKSVASLYDQLSRSLGLRPARVQDIEAKAAALAVFVARCNDGRTWAEAQREWIDEHAGDSEQSLANFIHTARSAYERVTGAPLDWKRRRGEKRDG